MELRHYASILYRWLWLILIGTLLAAGFTFLVSRSLPRIHEAAVTLLVNQAETPGNFAYNDILSNQMLSKTYSEMIRRRPILDQTIRELNLPYTLEELGKMVTVRPVRDTMLLEVRAESRNPLEAAEIANSMVQSFIEESQRSQMGQASRGLDSLQEQLRDLDASIRSTTSQMDQLRTVQDGRSIDVRLAEMSRLQSVLSQYQLSYSQLLKSEQELRLAEARARANVLVVEPAVPNPVPVRPRPVQNAALAAVIGFLFTLGVALLFEYLDDTVSSNEGVTRALGVPALGYVIRFRRRDASGLMRLMEHKPRSPIVEAFRVLRTNLQFTLLDRPGRAIVITSAGPHEGKSTTAANLAHVFAQAGKRVILVDADLRRPSLHRSFGLKNDLGLTTALLDPTSLDGGVLRQTGIDNLLVMTAGPLPPNPSELLGAPRMAALVEALKARSDIVLFDTPPVLVVTDPIVLSVLVDGVVLVVDSSSTRMQELVGVREALERARTSDKLLGAVLNKLGARSAGYYYYYYYYQQTYGYGPEGKNGKGRESTPAGTSAGQLPG